MIYGNYAHDKKYVVPTEVAFIMVAVILPSGTYLGSGNAVMVLPPVSLPGNAVMVLLPVSLPGNVVLALLPAGLPSGGIISSDVPGLDESDSSLFWFVSPSSLR